MGGASSVALEPNLDEFKSVTIEYNKLRDGGLSVHETYLIFDHRLQKNKTIDSSSNTLSISEVKGQTITNQPVVEKLGTVLLIDDSVTGTKISSKLLTSLSLNVLVANSAKKGFEMLQKQHDIIELILLDIIMPEDDGIVCLTWMKENEQTSKIPVYMLSGLEDAEIEKVCLSKGAKGMILKPITINRAEVILDECNIKHNKLFKKNNYAGHNARKDNEKTLTAAKAEPARSPRDVNNTSKSDIGSETPKIDINKIKSPAAVRGYKMFFDSHNTIITNFSNRELGEVVSTPSSSDSTCPSFQLIDSDMNAYYFPPNDIEDTIENIKNTLFIFLPTIYCAELYTENEGFLSLLSSYYSDIVKHRNHLSIVIISSDLPFALKAAKERFLLPFTLVSDVQLTVISKFVHLMNIGKIMAKFTLIPTSNSCSEEEMNFVVNEQNSFVGAMPGMLLANREREILGAWSMQTIDCKEIEIQPHHLYQFPVEFRTYLTISEKDFSAKNKLMKLQALIRAHKAKRSTLHNGNVKLNSPKTSIVGDKEVKEVKVSRDMHRDSVLQKHTFDLFDLTHTMTPNDVNNNGQSASKNPLSIATTSNSKSALSKQSSHNKRRVLVVDDSAVSSRLISRQLEKNNFIVTVTYNGQLALEILQKEDFDIVLCDVFMPICDGVSFLTQLYASKSSNKFRNLAVIMISGMEDQDLISKCIKLGAKEVLKKPFNMELFTTIVDKL